MGSNRVRDTIAGLAIVGVLLVTSTPATVFVGITERGLARSADAIVFGRVTNVTTQIGTQGSPETVATIAVDAAFKGEPRATITVRQRGGDLDDMGLWIPGAPTFREGDRQVLFLSRGAGGARRTVALGMGQFHVAAAADGTLVAQRSITEPVIGGSGVRRLSLRALRRIIDGAERDPTDTPDTVSLPVPTPAGFTIMSRPTARWFEADAGLPVTFRMDPAGDRALGYEAAGAAFDAALAAWTNVGGSSLRLVRGADFDPLPLLCDGTSQVVFNDPFNELGDPRQCSGVLAVGGYCSAGRSEPTVQIGDVEYRRITEGNITFNRGFGRCPFWNEANLGEILAHELGHTIGIDHSSSEDDEATPMLKEATMYYRAHFDGRGASLRPDDKAAARAIYPGAVIDDDDLDADGVTDRVDNCPGDDPTRAIANPGQTDLDGDGAGDLCDPCPLGNDCNVIRASRLRVRSRGGGTLIWTGLIDAPATDDEISMARLELVTANGSLVSSTLGANPAARKKKPKKKAGKKSVRLKLTSGLTRVTVRPAKRGQRKVKLTVKSATLGDGSIPLVGANLTLGDELFTTALICRPHPRRLLDCRS